MFTDAEVADGRKGVYTIRALKYVLAITLLLSGRAISATSVTDSASELKNANALHEQGDYAHSIPLLKEIVKGSPRDYKANLLLGEDLLRSGDPEAALAPLRIASESRADGDIALGFLADAAIELGDFSTAAKTLLAALGRAPESEADLLKWADFCIDRSRDLGIAMRKSKRGEATMLRVTAASHTERDEVRESLLTESAGKDPEQPGIWGELGAVQIAMGKNAEAAQSLKEAVRREPQSAATLGLEALSAAAEQRWPDAGAKLSALGARSPAELRHALEAWPQYLVPGPEVTGRVWDCLRNHGAGCALTSARAAASSGLSARDLYAAGRWEQLIARPGVDNASGAESLWAGVALARTDDCARALPALERGAKGNELTAGLWLEICYAKAGENVVARLTKMGDEVALHELKGDLLLRLRNDGEAAEWEYAEALKLKPKDEHLLARLADASDRIGDAAQAKASAMAALSEDSHESLALRIMARIAISERDYDQAIERLNALIATGSADDWVQVQLGVAYGQSGQPELAVRYLQTELRAGYPDPKGGLHAMLAASLRKLGRDDEAHAAAAEAAKLAQSASESDGSDVHP